ncbi:hypothetical protein ACH4E8_19760 [Streptomyces sp. NPDC017979]|uniref:hypothetical protein n=1 Tax=Streptomyces sp. NPDC017979 TaxID=3365024 RepID=UPI0037BB57E0
MSQQHPQNTERILTEGACLMTRDDDPGNLVGDALGADGRLLEEGRDLADDRARVIDGTGNTVLPGFIDTRAPQWTSENRYPGTGVTGYAHPPLTSTDMRNA